MRLSETVGLRQQDLKLDHELPHVALVPYATRRLKTDSSERVIPLVGASLWAAQCVAAVSLRVSKPTSNKSFRCHDN